MLHLAYAEEGDKEVPFFGEGKYEDKLDKYDEIDEGEDIHDIVVARKVAYYVSFWFVGRPNTQKEFQEMIDMALKLDEESEEPPKEEKKQVKS